MSLAAETRASVRRRPFLLTALRAGVVNYAAAARQLDVSEDTEAVATALRRYGEQLPPLESQRQSARVTMQRGLEPATAETVLTVGDNGFAPGDGSLTGVAAAGAVDAGALAHALNLLDSHGVTIHAAGVADETLLVIVDHRDGADAVRLVEAALDSVPNSVN